MTARYWSRSWSRYEACPRCGAAEDTPCINQLRKDRAPSIRPHYGRHRKPEPYRSPRHSSRLAEICIGVMVAAGKRPVDLVEPLGWHFNTVYRALAEEKRRMKVTEAEQILAVLGYRLEHRAVPMEPVEEE